MVLNIIVIAIAVFGIAKMYLY